MTHSFPSRRPAELKDPDILEERPESVKTGLVVEEIEGEAPGWSSKTGRIEQPKQRRKQLPKSKLPKKAKKAGHPGFIAPALATLKAAPPSGRKWLHEIKFDGYRLQAHVRPHARSGKAKLFTRNGLDWSSEERRVGKECVSTCEFRGSP